MNITQLLMSSISIHDLECVINVGATCKKQNRDHLTEADVLTGYTTGDGLNMSIIEIQ